MGWILLFTGGLIAVLPGMVTQTVNGGSLLGALIATGGVAMVARGVKDV